MCGIFGYIGEKDALPILLRGLKCLEYRGYDSAGVALISGGALCVRKATGRLDALERVLHEKPVAGSVGVGHTRWATHGGPTDENAHPHTDAAGRFAVVHNGIIENHLALRALLEKEGYVFTSQTDTEVVAHLLARSWHGDLKTCVQEAVSHLRGSFALGILCREHPDVICCVRQDSPLAVGLGQGECFIASDIPALLPYTDRVIFPPEKTLVMVSRAGAVCFDAFGHPVALREERIAEERQSAELNGYPHYMLKEIDEQPAALRRQLAACVEEGRLKPGMLPVGDDALRRAARVLLVACGSAYHAACAGRLMIERLAGIPAEADVASEFRYREPVVHEDDLCVFISQSGETADTLAALRLAKEKACCMAIVNAAGSTLEREAGGALRQHAGPEIAVATTKGYLTQIQSLFLLALALGRAKGALDEARERELLTALTAVPARLEGVLTDRARIQRFAANNVDRRSVFYIGRGMDWAAAMEGSLKLKEISYAHSEAYAAGELKHGTIALIEPGSLVIALVTQPELGAKMESNIREVRARGAQVLALCAESAAPQIAPVADGVWLLPDAPWALAPLLSVPPMQLFAYYTALQRGCDVDKPRNLAKSVTVE